jgi:hypothetical protein
MSFFSFPDFLAENKMVMPINIIGYRNSLLVPQFAVEIGCLKSIRPDTNLAAALAL